MTVDLYHGEPASNSLKVLQAIHEKGVPFTSHYINLMKFEQHAPAYVAINPAGQVPTLVHDGRVLTESTVINEYIDDAFDGPPLKPADPYLQGQMRIWTKYVDEVFRPSLSFLAWHRVIPGMAKALPEGEFEARLKRIPLKEKRDKWELAAKGGFSERELEGWRANLEDVTDRVEGALAGHDWLVGGMFTLADIAVFAMAISMPRSYPDLWNETRTPQAMAWMARMKARPGVAAALAMPDHTGMVSRKD
ncbi:MULTISPECIES: glutathione S-transferase family protein [unclassified Sphingobium]|uniref:glutathione S-transferase family protein n=1 Tax=unclassified Sphingobium TaxID=2611147 RepID=UPI0022256A35|nr:MULTISPECIES: glutathione S-transferase family protein [unclassified Sphingobium]MCW2411680.1 glutathione S-transferase [Sphingobium sp. B8D3D]MCW2416027.1 glutathione S-transferase [Sphingobium sp. B8D3A]